MKTRSMYQAPGKHPGDLTFRCANCGRDWFLPLGNHRQGTSHRTKIGGRDWCDECVAKRYRRHRNMLGGVLSETPCEVLMKRRLDI